MWRGPLTSLRPRDRLDPCTARTAARPPAACAQVSVASKGELLGLRHADDSDDESDDGGGPGPAGLAAGAADGGGFADGGGGGVRGATLGRLANLLADPSLAARRGALAQIEALVAEACAVRAQPGLPSALAGEDDECLDSSDEAAAPAPPADGADGAEGARGSASAVGELLQVRAGARARRGAMLVVLCCAVCVTAVCVCA
jgi:hypothetical protein